jgi:signal transduction histidine kinase
MDEPRQESRRDPRGDPPMVYALYLLIYLATLLRMILRTPEQGLIQAPAYALMAAFLAVGVIQVPLSGRLPWWIHLHLAVQVAIVMALFLTEPTVDFYAILIVQLSVVATRELPDRWDTAWLSALCVMVVLGLLLAFGPIGEVLSYVPTYIAACLLLGLYGRATKKAEAARARSEELRAELESANARLRAYAEEAEAAAAAQERAKLSRELHDAATQTVFSMNLTAEAARAALAEDPSRLPVLLDRLQELARGALAELRSLVGGLRPSVVEEEGLVRGLERHIAARGRRDGMRILLAVRGDERGGPAVKKVLFRAAVEALNNVSKHSGVSEARIELSFGATEATARVSDSGRGFDGSAALPRESYGLSSLREEIEALGGELSVRSAPGAGTQVEARLPLGAAEGGR